MNFDTTINRQHRARAASAPRHPRPHAAQVLAPFPGRTAPREARCSSRATRRCGTRAVPRPGAPARPSGPSAALLPRASYYGRCSSPVVTHARRATYLNAALPYPRADTSRSASIAAPRQACPPASIPGRPTIQTSSLGPIEACAVVHCSALRLPRRCHSPPRPPPPSTATRPRRSCLRADQPRQSTLSEPLGGPAPLDG
jgi:hypothetical protein